MSLRFCLLFILLPFAVLAQTVDELDAKNGFKDIKLTTDVSGYPGLEYRKDTEDGVFPETKLYGPKKGYYENIGNLKIYDLEVSVYNDQIYRITVITEKDPNLYKGLKINFGEPTFDIRTNNYFWAGKNVKLTYISHSKNKIVMTYHSYQMVKKLKEDKHQVVEDIANDF